METQMHKTTVLNDGEWLIKETKPQDVFIPEDFSEEDRMIRDMSEQFVKTEVVPLIDRINNLEPGLMPSLLKKAGELGLLGASVPEQYNGLGKDLVTSSIINEAFGAGYSFCVSFTAHTGIGSTPILYFGTEEQRQKYST